MKKIVAAASLATLLAGAAFAADISFSYTGGNYFKSNGDNLKYDSDSRWDCMSLGLSTDYAGVLVDWDTDGGDLAMDAYYGWMKFAQINTEFKGGIWASRYVNRVNDDAGDLDGEDFEYYKPGVINFANEIGGASNYTVAKDSDNLTLKNLALIATWQNDSGLLVRGGLVNASWDSYTETDTDGSTTRTNGYGFAAEVGYHQEGSFNVNAAVRSLHVGNYSFGLFFSPEMIEKLSATVGFSLGLDTYDLSKRNSNVKDETGVEFGFDLRARYQVTEKLAVTTMNNISNYLIYKNANDSKKTTDTTKFGNALGMWNMVNLTYQFLDNMKFGLTLNHAIVDFSTVDDDGSYLVVSPSVAIAATERANVTISGRAQWENIGFNKGDESFAFTVPVIFSYSF